MIMSKADPTPEEIEAARALVLKADNAASEARKAEVLAKLQPLVATGFGAENAVIDLAALSAVMPSNYAGLADVDPNLASQVLSVVSLNQSVNDRIRNLVALNSPPAAA
ncbi:MAG: hypothetical protein DI624_14470 [Brevundimonas sp.]|nr:MAG: hypothetical protein DI624_14470 [Brevundimonas sp.]